MPPRTREQQRITADCCLLWLASQGSIQSWVILLYIYLYIHTHIGGGGKGEGGGGKGMLLIYKLIYYLIIVARVITTICLNKLAKHNPCNVLCVSCSNMCDSFSTNTFCGPRPLPPPPPPLHTTVGGYASHILQKRFQAEHGWSNHQP